jgi:hypothetical protein
VAEAHQVPHGFLLGQICTLTEDVEARHWNGHDHERHGLPEFTPTPWPAGTRVKVVSVSRFWHCGITTVLTAENGYDACVSPGILLTDNETPEIAAKRADCHHWFLEQRKADLAFIEERRARRG